MDGIVTIVSFTRVLVSCVVRMMFGLVVLAPSPQLYGKVPRLIRKKTNRLTQTVVFSSKAFSLRRAVVNCTSAEHEGLSTHVQR